MTMMLGQEKPSLEDLSHHGVKGMHWGIRKKYEPTGRDSAAPKDASSSVATKVQDFRTQRRSDGVVRLRASANLMDTRISELKSANAELAGTRSPIKMYTRSANQTAINNYTQQRDRLLKDAEAKQNGKLTSTQKNLLIGGAVVGGILLAGAIYQGRQSGALNSLQLRGKAFVTGKKSPFTIDKSLAKPGMSAKEILERVSGPVNPNYRSAGGQMNCRRSTFAHELRRRGYDVAATTAAQGTGQSESGFINAVTPGSRNFIRSLSVSTSVQKAEQAYIDSSGAIKRVTRVAKGDKRTNPLQKTILENLRVPDSLYSDRYNKLAESGRMAEALKMPVSDSLSVLRHLETSQPNGARGEVLFNFGGFGHSMAYEIIEGKAHIFDSQKAKLYDAATRVESKWDGFHSAEITRLDNADLDIGFLTRWATNRK